MFFLNAVDEVLIFNLLKPGGYFMYHHDQHSESLHGPDNALHVFLWILQQTATVAIYCINRVGFVTEVERFTAQLLWTHTGWPTVGLNPSEKKCFCTLTGQTDYKSLH